MVTNVLTQVRIDLVDALKTAGINAVHYGPEQFNDVPICVVQPSSPYVTMPESNVFRTPYRVFMDVLAVSEKSDHEGTAEGIDGLLASVLSALEDWNVYEVAAPGLLGSNTEYAAAVVTVYVDTDIEKEAN